MQNTKLASKEQILPIVVGFWQARALAVATELALPDLLAEGPLPLEDLAIQTKTDASALFRLLRALASIGIFAEASPRVFVNSATSETLRKDSPSSQRPMVLHCLSKYKKSVYPQIPQIDTDSKTRRDGRKRGVLNTLVPSPSAFQSVSICVICG